MYRVYFDWNVMQRINRSSRHLTMEKIGDLLDRNKLGFNLVYSRAHILDLLKSSRSQEALHKNVFPDLEHINELTGKQYIGYNLMNGMAYPIIADAKELFEEELSSGGDIIGLDFLFSHSHEDPEENALSKSALIGFKHRPSGINFSDAESAPYYAKIFTRTLKEDNQYNMLLDFNDYLHRIENDPTDIMEIAEIFLNKTGLDLVRISGSTEPIAEIDEALKKTSFKNDFLGLTNLDIDDPVIKTNQFFFRFVLEYIILNLAGFRRDKLGGKNKYSNFLHDILHAFHGCFCDYFVSADKKQIAKAQILYRHHKIDTVALNPKDFVNIASAQTKKNKTADDIFRLIKDTITDCDPCVINHQDSEVERICSYRPAKDVLGYFNTIYAIYYKDRTMTNAIVISREVNILLPINIFSETAAIVEKLAMAFGDDSDRKNKLSAKELKEIEANKWKGRTWVVNDAEVKLLWNPESKRLVLVLKFLNPSNSG